MSTIPYCTPTHNLHGVIVFLTLQSLLGRLSVSKSFLYAAIAEGALPPPVRLGGARRWIEREIELVQQLIVSGASLSEQKALVKQLVEARRLSAPLLRNDGTSTAACEG